jgi:hypothetical protein
LAAVEVEVQVEVHDHVHVHDHVDVHGWTCLSPGDSE